MVHILLRINISKYARGKFLFWEMMMLGYLQNDEIINLRNLRLFTQSWILSFRILKELFIHMLFTEYYVSQLMPSGISKKEGIIWVLVRNKMNQDKGKKSRN